MPLSDFKRGPEDLLQAETTRYQQKAVTSGLVPELLRPMQHAAGKRHSGAK